jgi:primosomal protein N'
MPLTAYCTYCGGSHPVALCPSTYGGSAARTSLRCTYCGSTTHEVDFCPKTFAGEANRRSNPSGSFID